MTHDEIKIPLMTLEGLEYLIIKPSRFGDPNSVTVVIPKGALITGVMELPRSFFDLVAKSKLTC
ncbi:MAG TPA: hypothetical protein VH187_05430 [Scandinavium sp.]|jgi:hypothetical protein|uniref:hypothetical protein n=1 Tax=Scandinavium sp. TaxID=2830653 RepID=UPI002E35C53E|nr:hypothetical protein [Scandinavium sp.]HEX4500602.1 hypothetical protein [Scandinavium sp.]